MRARITLLAAALLTLGVTAGPALAFEPPADAAKGHFGCVEGEDNAVAGHPGAAGIVDAAGRVAQLTGDTTPTAWNAVDHADPIELGSCS